MTRCAGFGASAPHADLTLLSFERRALRRDDVSIAIAYCGVCHTDVHVVNNDLNTTVYPCVPGHEIIGHVQAVGPDVTRFRVGEAVAVGVLVDSCQACLCCEHGEAQHCLHGATHTYNGKDRQTGEITYGGYADHIVVRERFVFRVPPALDLRTAAPLLCAGITVWSPLKRHAVGPGSRVAVAGLGGLGHMAVKLAAALGAEVTVITTSPGKVNDAKTLGARHVLLSSDAGAMTSAASSFDLIVDTIPTRHNVNPYLQLLARRGNLTAVGALELLEPVHGALLVRNDRSLSGSFIGGLNATQELLDFCATHGIAPSCELIDIRDINTAYRRMLANDVKYRFVIDMTTLAQAVRASP